MDLEIKEYSSEDIDNSLKKLWIKLAQEMYELEHFTLPSESNANLWLDYLRSEIIERRGFLLGAFDETKLVGFAAASYARRFPMQVSERMGTINDLFVLPKYRRKGIGSKLVVDCLKKMESGDVDSVRINLVSGNESALALYQKVGFEVYRLSVKRSLAKDE